MRTQIKSLGIIVLALSIQGIARAQEPASPPKPLPEKPASTPASPRRAPIPLKLSFVISKYQGEKKITSLPYTVSLNAEGVPSRLRMGAQVPIATTRVADGAATPSYNYRDVGVSIDAHAFSMDDGRFRVEISVNDSSVVANNQAAGTPTVGGAPVLRNFSTTNTVLLRDAQTAQFVTAADPLAGDVMRIDVTLTVVK